MNRYERYDAEQQRNPLRLTWNAPDVQASAADTGLGCCCVMAFIALLLILATIVVIAW